MKLHELFEDIDLTGDQNISSLEKDPKNLTDIINVTGTVDLSSTDTLKEIPWKFGTVSGDFYCIPYPLESLKNCPTRVEGSFWCVDNKLKSLKYCPKFVGKDFHCESNDLTSLVHCPEYVGNDFKYTKNKIKSLVGIHKILKHCTKFKCDFNPIEEGGLGLLLIDGLIEIYTDHPALRIIAKYVGQGKKGMMLAHAELIENGYEAFAKL